MAVGVFAAVAFAAVLASSAGAALRVNPVSTTATSTGAVGLIDSTGTTTQLTCAASALAANVVDATNVTVPLGGATFSTCSLGTAVTQASAWTAAFDALLATDGTITGIRLRLTIPTNGLAFRAALGCTFAVGGTATLLSALRPAAVPPTLAAMPALTADATLGLRVTSVTSNALCPAIALGDLARASGTWSFSPAPTFTLPVTIGPGGAFDMTGDVSDVSSTLGTITCATTLSGSVTAGEYVRDDTIGTVTSGTARCDGTTNITYLMNPAPAIKWTGPETINAQFQYTNIRATIFNLRKLIATGTSSCLYQGNVIGLANIAPNPGNPVTIGSITIGNAIGGNVLALVRELSAPGTCAATVTTETLLTLGAPWRVRLG